MFAWVMLALGGWTVLGVLVNAYEVGWSLVNLARYPVDLFLALAAMAMGVWVCHTYLGW